MKKPKGSGTFNEKVTIWRPELSIDEETGSKIFSPKKIIDRAWSSVKFIGTPSAGASEDRINDQRTGKSKIELVMRYNNRVKFEDFVIYLGGFFEIYSIQMPDKRSHLVLRAEMRDDFTYSIGNTTSEFNEYMADNGLMPGQPIISNESPSQDYEALEPVNDDFIVISQGTEHFPTPINNKYNSFYISPDYVRNPIRSSGRMDEHVNELGSTVEAETPYDALETGHDGANYMAAAFPATSVIYVFQDKHRDGIAVNEDVNFLVSSDVGLRKYFWHEYEPSTYALATTFELAAENTRYPVSYYGRTHGKVYFQWISTEEFDSYNNLIEGQVLRQSVPVIHEAQLSNRLFPICINTATLQWRTYHSNSLYPTSSHSYGSVSILSKYDRDQGRLELLSGEKEGWTNFGQEYTYEGESRTRTNMLHYTRPDNDDIERWGDVYQPSEPMEAIIGDTPQLPVYFAGNVATEDVNMLIKDVKATVAGSNDYLEEDIDLMPYLTDFEAGIGYAKFEGLEGVLPGTDGYDIDLTFSVEVTLKKPVDYDVPVCYATNIDDPAHDYVEADYDAHLTNPEEHPFDFSFFPTPTEEYIRASLNQFSNDYSRRMVVGRAEDVFPINVKVKHYFQS